MNERVVNLVEEPEHIFSIEWFCVARADTLSNHGDYSTCELASEPIVVFRDQDRELRAMSNVCMRRGST